MDKQSIFCKICQKDYAISKVKSSWRIWNFVNHLKALHALENESLISNMTEVAENTQVDSHSLEENMSSISNMTVETENTQAERVERPVERESSASNGEVSAVIEGNSGNNNSASDITTNKAKKKANK